MDGFQHNFTAQALNTHYNRGSPWRWFLALIMFRSPQPEPAELLVNGSFENGSYTGGSSGMLLPPNS
jgi:hypothetical protein